MAWLSIVLLAIQTDALERQSNANDKQRSAIEYQKNSNRRQANLAPSTNGYFFVLHDPSSKPSCSPLPLLRQNALVESASTKHGVPSELLRAVIVQESGFRPCSVSSRGAIGLMQLMPGTSEQLGVNDALEPDENVDAGTRLLKTLIERYGGDLNRVLGPYNAGIGAVEKAGGVPAFAETTNYIQEILDKLVKPD
jgi:soluble lytic murein transglycosylase-like protein